VPALETLQFGLAVPLGLCQAIVPEVTYLCSSLSFPLWVCLPNKVQIFLIQHGLLLLSLSASSLLVLSAATFSFLRLFIFVINDETFSNLSSD
jgi:hypothetical protein